MFRKQFFKLLLFGSLPEDIFVPYQSTDLLFRQAQTLRTSGTTFPWLVATLGIHQARRNHSNPQQALRTNND